MSMVTGLNGTFACLGFDGFFGYLPISALMGGSTWIWSGFTTFLWTLLAICISWGPEPILTCTVHVILDLIMNPFIILEDLKLSCATAVSIYPDELRDITHQWRIRKETPLYQNILICKYGNGSKPITLGIIHIYNHQLFRNEHARHKFWQYVKTSVDLQKVGSKYLPRC